MARDLQGKVAVVTGGAGGIGLDIADEFLRHDAKVAILLDINENLGAEAVHKLNSTHGMNKAVFIKCDVTTDLEEVTRYIIDTYKYVDVLVNNAGIVNEIDAKKIIGLNLIAVIEWSLKYVELMRTDRGGTGGTIINMSSVYGFRVDPYMPLYKASKYGVMGFTKTKGHRNNFDKTGVRLVALCPGFTETKLALNLEEVTEQAGHNLEELTAFLETLPWQSSRAVGVAAVDVFQKANSGTAWVIEGGEIIKDV